MDVMVFRVALRVIMIASMLATWRLKMAHSHEVLHADSLRRDGKISWEEYGRLLHGKFVHSMAEYMGEMARGIRDRNGRLLELEDLGGR